MRKEPLGGVCTPEVAEDEELELAVDKNMKSSRPHEEVIVLAQERGPLGIHVVPEHQGSVRNQGLIVQGVESGGRIHRDGRIGAGDKIVHINGTSLIGLPFQLAQQLFREGLNCPQGLTLHVIKKNDTRSGGMEEKENMVHSQQKSELDSVVFWMLLPFKVLLKSEGCFLCVSVVVGDAKVATVATTRKMLPLQSVPMGLPGGATTSLIASNTRKIGRKYEIDLQKGPSGLGFSVTTRDNPAGGYCPIYVKNILPTVSITRKVSALVKFVHGQCK